MPQSLKQMMGRTVLVLTPFLVQLATAAARAVSDFGRNLRVVRWGRQQLMDRLAFALRRLIRDVPHQNLRSS